MTREHDEPTGEDTAGQPVARKRPSRRRAAVAGVAGLAAVLGVTAYVTTDKIVGDGSAAKEVGTIGASTPEANTIPAASSSAGPSIPVTSSASAPRSIAPEVRKTIEEARRKMAEDGVQVKRPVKPKTKGALKDVEQIQTGSVKEGGAVRIIAARGDMTGQRELAYVAGGVTKAGKAQCSQTLKFSSDPKPEKKDNLMMCWRTSKDKSVVAMVVDYKGNPSKNKAVQAVEEKWRSMD